MGKSKGKLTQHKTNKKGKRWRKGQSSSSNPTTRRFRESAKNKFFNQNTGPSSLTEAAIAKHNEGQDGDIGDDRMSDVVSQTDKLSLTAKTFNTWASNWTECTNTSFSRVHRLWKSNSAFHKEILAILAAVTEVIKAQGGTESETEYLGALLTALETAENEQTLAAISYLISLVLKRVPVAVLRTKFSEIAKKLLNYLSLYADGQSTSLLKSLLMSLAALLRVQEPMIWNNPSTNQIYSGLLTFVVHSKPKVRKAAHRAVNIILKGSVFMTLGEAPPHHPAATTTAKYCGHQIEECGGKGETLVTLHVLALLRDIMGLFPQQSLKSVCETILRVMTLSNVMVTACSMQALHGMFLTQPKANRLPAELNAQIITALFEYQPSDNDVQPTQAWLTVMEEAHVNLGRLQEKLCISHLPRIVTVAMNSLLSERREVAESAAQMIKGLITNCLGPAGESLGSLINSSNVSQTPVQKIQSALEKGLGYQYHAAWGLVLEIFSVYYTSLGKYCWNIMIKSLETIAELRESHKFAYKGQLDHAIGCAIKTMGPEHVLQAVKLNITGDSDRVDFPRSWLLPVLRETIQETELTYFTSYFLPLAVQLKLKADGFKEANHTIQAKSYDALQLQIWSLLPRFCIRPTDLPKAFPGLAKVLGTALNERVDLRMDILSSLRKLILQNLDNEECRSVLSKFGKNYIPILFNLYTTDESDKVSDMIRPAVLETIKIYLQIIDSQLTNSLLSKCLSKMTEEGLEKLSSYNLLDLSVAMIQYAEKSHVQSLYQLAKSHVDVLERTLQKKCYRLLEEICAGKSLPCRKFVKETLPELQEILLHSLSSSGPSSKAPRLKCLHHLCNLLEAGDKQFIVAVIPEAILCTKEIGERARQAAYNLLIEMAAMVIKWSTKPEEDSLEEYFSWILPGLAGAPHMISATLLALTRLFYQYKGKINDRLLEMLIENCCLLLSAKQREILKSTLAFVRVIIASFSEVKLASYLQQMITSLVSLKEETRRHFRFETKQIFTKLTRKFGFETVSSMVPETYKKVLGNIRKTQERAKKNRQHEIDGDDDETDKQKQAESIEDLLQDTDSEDEDESDKRKKKSSKKSKQQKQSGEAWLREDDQTEIMDFLDSSAAKKVMATKPQVKLSEKKTGDFKLSSDGRLIITGEQEDKPGDSGDDDDLQDLLDAFESNKKQKNRKRKLDVELDDDEDGVTTSKYKAGGSGIHRPLGKGQKSTEKKNGRPAKESGQEYKAKKAGGDIKKKGKPDPYAYVPLQMSNLNRRKQAKLKGQFSGFVRGAKKGAAKGAKAKRKTRQ